MRTAFAIASSSLARLGLEFSLVFGFLRLRSAPGSLSLRRLIFPSIRPALALCRVLSHSFSRETMKRKQSTRPNFAAVRRNRSR